MSFQIPGIGPKTESKLQQLNIFSDWQLLYHFPHRYIDFSRVIPISKINLNENCTLSGQIVHLENIYTRSLKSLQKIILKDRSGQVELVWFNQPFLIKNFKIGDSWAFAGTPTLYRGKTTIFSPEYGQYNTGKIIPIYPETKGLTSRWFRKIIGLHFDTLQKNLVDLLPQTLINSYNLLPLKQALQEIHQPQNQKLLAQSRYRLGLDEILSLLTLSRLQKKSWALNKPKFILKSNKTIDSKIKTLISSLPFSLTESQVQAWSEIKPELTSKNKVSNRLLCGDVGSGKTIIALLSTYLTSLNNRQSLVLAPTEILGKQHLKTFQKYLPSTPVYFLSAHQSLPAKIPRNSIIIATHAAIFQKDKFIKNTALLVVDEQHKFGVKQRSFLSQNSPPHTLTMTATPIPRSISLTFFGNLDLSTLKNPPQNRLRIKTFLVPQNKIPACYQWLQKDILKRHSQAFIVCPFIEESESAVTIKSAKKEFEILKNIFPKLKLALIHGKTDIETRNKILENFQKNKINVLVTTPIIEVGIDFPNATTIIIQSADHFGLSQLHQLRGRVGRGALQSYCYLFTESINDSSLKRLEFLSKNSDGFKIAEYDLKTRGPGEVFSTLQHGFPSLKIANLSDIKLIELSQKILTDLEQNYPNFDLEKLVKNQKSLSMVGNHLN
ncbi:MAG: RecG-like protein helicase [Candidatus Shapirobacteria bacterium GW2011_GWF1_38_23]|nr:MAG: RecG-like protein helicase [Candidatus Shapirobacteria bacterium GW2011_GWF2_37_20]KKQ65176.1 MAG: RecG-like protein helicase [Candidatus Shapirobacteria bacterium GW2011_GWF1_38_23]